MALLFRDEQGRPLGPLPSQSADDSARSVSVSGLLPEPSTEDPVDFTFTEYHERDDGHSYLSADEEDEFHLQTFQAATAEVAEVETDDDDSKLTPRARSPPDASDDYRAAIERAAVIAKAEEEHKRALQQELEARVAQEASNGVVDSGGKEKKKKKKKKKDKKEKKEKKKKKKKKKKKNTQQEEEQKEVEEVVEEEEEPVDNHADELKQAKGTSNGLSGSPTAENPPEQLGNGKTKTKRKKKKTTKPTKGAVRSAWEEDSAAKETPESSPAATTETSKKKKKKRRVKKSSLPGSTSSELPTTDATKKKARSLRNARALGSTGSVGGMSSARSTRSTKSGKKIKTKTKKTKKTKKKESSDDEAPQEFAALLWLKKQQEKKRKKQKQQQQQEQQAREKKKQADDDDDDDADADAETGTSDSAPAPKKKVVPKKKRKKRKNTLKASQLLTVDRDPEYAASVATSVAPSVASAHTVQSTRSALAGGAGARRRRAKSTKGKLSARSSMSAAVPAKGRGKAKSRPRKTRPQYDSSGRRIRRKRPARATAVSEDVEPSTAPLAASELQQRLDFLASRTEPEISEDEFGVEAPTSPPAAAPSTVLSSAQDEADADIGGANTSSSSSRAQGSGVARKRGRSRRRAADRSGRVSTRSSKSLGASLRKRSSGGKRPGSMLRHYASAPPQNFRTQTKSPSKKRMSLPLGKVRSRSMGRLGLTYTVKLKKKKSKKKTAMLDEFKFGADGLPHMRSSNADGIYPPWRPTGYVPPAKPEFLLEPTGDNKDKLRHGTLYGKGSNSAAYLGPGTADPSRESFPRPGRGDDSDAADHSDDGDDELEDVPPVPKAKRTKKKKKRGGVSARLLGRVAATAANLTRKSRAARGTSSARRALSSSKRPSTAEEMAGDAAPEESEHGGHSADDEPSNRKSKGSGASPKKGRRRKKPVVEPESSDDSDTAAVNMPEDGWTVTWGVEVPEESTDRGGKKGKRKKGRTSSTGPESDKQSWPRADKPTTVYPSELEAFFGQFIEVEPANYGGKVQRYQITPEAPQGMSFNTTTGVLKGTPRITFRGKPFVITALNRGGKCLCRIEITISTNIPLFTYKSPLRLFVNEVMKPIKPRKKGGKDLTFSLASGSPPLPRGIFLNSETGAITGRPLDNTKPIDYHIVGRTSTVGMGSVVLRLAVMPRLPHLQYPNPIVAQVGVDMPAIEPESKAGPVDRVEVVPLEVDDDSQALPDGMSIDEVTGALHGCPRAPCSPRIIRLRVHNIGGRQDTSIRVAVLPALPKVEYITDVFHVGKKVDLRPTVHSGPVDLYRLSEESGRLPRGLEFDTGTGRVHGVPRVHCSQHTLMVGAVNTAGWSPAELVLTILPPKPELAYPDSPMMVEIGEELLLQPEIQAGPIDAFTIDPPLPENVELGAKTGIIRGKSSEPFEATDFTVTATNLAGATTLTVKLGVLPGVPVVQYPSPMRLFVDEKMDPITPTVQGGAVEHFELFPGGDPLPAGLHLDTDTGAISGTPTGIIAEETSFEVLASNASGTDTVELSLVVLPRPPSISYPTVRLTLGKRAKTIVPKNAGGPSDSFAIVKPDVHGSSPLPRGLKFDNATGAISGVPAQICDAVEYTVEAKGLGGARRTDFTITVLPPPPQVEYAPTRIGLGQELDAAPETKSSHGPFTYRLQTSSAALPLGLHFNEETGTFSGRVEEICKPLRIPVEVSNPAGSVVVEFPLHVVPQEPEFEYAPLGVVATQGTPLALRAEVVQGPIDRFTVTPKLPSGLQLDQSTGTITGTPTKPTMSSKSYAASPDDVPMKTYTISGTNESGSFSTELDLAVVPGAARVTYHPPGPASGSDADDTDAMQPLSVVVGQEIDPITPHVAFGKVQSYCLNDDSPPLPAGLALDTHTGEIYGTPTEVTPLQSYAVEAHNAAGIAPCPVLLQVLSMAQHIKGQRDEQLARKARRAQQRVEARDAALARLSSGKTAAPSSSTGKSPVRRGPRAVGRARLGTLGSSASADKLTDDDAAEVLADAEPVAVGRASPGRSRRTPNSSSLRPERLQHSRSGGVSPSGSTSSLSPTSPSKARKGPVKRSLSFSPGQKRPSQDSPTSPSARRSRLPRRSPHSSGTSPHSPDFDVDADARRRRGPKATPPRSASLSTLDWKAKSRIPRANINHRKVTIPKNNVQWNAGPKVDTRNKYKRQSNVKIPTNSVKWKASSKVDARNNYKRQQSPAKLATNSVDWEASPKVDTHNDYSRESNVKIPVNSVNWKASPKVDTRNDYERQSRFTPNKTRALSWEAEAKVVTHGGLPSLPGRDVTHETYDVSHFKVKAEEDAAMKREQERLERLEREERAREFKELRERERLEREQLELQEAEESRRMHLLQREQEKKAKEEAKARAVAERQARLREQRLARQRKKKEKAEAVARAKAEKARKVREEKKRLKLMKQAKTQRDRMSKRERHHRIRNRMELHEDPNDIAHAAAAPATGMQADLDAPALSPPSSPKARTQSSSRPAARRRPATSSAGSSSGSASHAGRGPSARGPSDRSRSQRSSQRQRKSGIPVRSASAGSRGAKDRASAPRSSSAGGQPRQPRQPRGGSRSKPNRTTKSAPAQSGGKATRTSANAGSSGSSSSGKGKGAAGKSLTLKEMIQLRQSADSSSEDDDEDEQDTRRRSHVRKSSSLELEEHERAELEILRSTVRNKFGVVSAMTSVNPTDLPNIDESQPLADQTPRSAQAAAQSRLRKHRLMERALGLGQLQEVGDDEDEEEEWEESGPGVYYEDDDDAVPEYDMHGNLIEYEEEEEEDDEQPDALHRRSSHADMLEDDDELS